MIHMYMFHFPAVFGSWRCNKRDKLALAHHMRKVRQVGVTDFQKVLRMTWNFFFSGHVLRGAVKYYFADFVHMGSTPPPLYGQKFQQGRSYGLSGYPPFTDKICKVVFDGLP